MEEGDKTELVIFKFGRKVRRKTIMTLYWHENRQTSISAIVARKEQVRFHSMLCKKEGVKRLKKINERKSSRKM